MLTIELLNACASFAAFDQQGQCALRAPGLVALTRMQAKAEDLNAFVRSYDAQLQASPAWEAWPAGEAWGFALGQAQAWPQYRDLFFQWLAYEAAGQVLPQALPRLTRSCGAAGFDGLLRTAYAVEARHHHELADALSLWACCWQERTPLPGAAAGAGSDALPVLRQLPRIANKAGDWAQTMHQAANTPALLRAAGQLHTDSDTLEQLAGLAAQAYACTGNAAAQALLSSADAMRRILPHMDEPDLALRSYWQDFAATVAVAGLHLGKAPTGLPWPELLRQARASRDVRSITLVDCCHQTAQAYGRDGWWRSAATRAVQDAVA
ncbi:MAG: DUF4243 domain-containing protein [Rhodoferax sp.]|nr:DUF4243 domain-containing protein [Rhodoferax sp.]